jgi:hypothetical protein
VRVQPRWSGTDARSSSPGCRPRRSGRASSCSRAVASYTYSASYAFPTDRAADDLELYHFAPDGTLREHLAPEPIPSLHPTLAWAGGRIALTYVRVGLGQPEEHVLRYLDCPVD